MKIGEPPSERMTACLLFVAALWWIRAWIARSPSDFAIGFGWFVVGPLSWIVARLWGRRG